MAQVVLIAEGTYKEGINNIGDVVGIHEDGTIGGGIGYATFKVLQVPGTKAEIEALLNSRLPIIKRCFRMSAANEWQKKPPEEAEFWQDGTDWKKIETRPKYQINIACDSKLEADLADSKISNLSKQTLIDAAATSNLKALPENQVVTSITLNTLESSK